MVFTALLGCYKISVAQEYDVGIQSLRFPTQLHDKTLLFLLTQSQSKEREYILLADDAESAQRARRDWEGTWDSIDGEVQAIGELSTRFTLQESKDDVAEIRTGLTHLRTIQGSCFEVRKPNQTATMFAAARCMLPANASIDKVRAAVTGIDKNTGQLMRAETEKLQAAIASIYHALIWSTALAVGLGGLIALGLSRKITSAVGEVLARSEAIAAHDLSGAELQVLSEDEIGDLVRAVNKMQASLSGIVQQVATSAEHLASASEEISASAIQQSDGVNQQKGQTEQMATAMHEMSVTVHEISDNSNAAAQASSKATESAHAGGEVVGHTLEIMRVISSAVSETAGKIEQLGKGSERIGKIIGVIDDIADQTNLLALNAAIEAARAGEQGRGFAVVADEVRKLAERTSSATKEITGMIEEIQKETARAVEAMNAGTKHVESGVVSTQEAGKSLQEIIGASDKVGEMIAHIATAATEQASATQEVNHNVEQIATITASTATGAEQSARACQELSNLASNLHNIVGQFILGSSGQGARNIPRESSSRSSNAQFDHPQPQNSPSPVDWNEHSPFIN
jgi:methyl-accepting chemotaxis protein